MSRIEEIEAQMEHSRNISRFELLSHIRFLLARVKELEERLRIVDEAYRATIRKEPS